MGLELLGDAKTWPGLIYDRVSTTSERARRAAAAERVKLYRDDYKTILAYTLSRIFSEPAVYRRIETLIGLIGGTSFLKRVADELGRSLYARAPMRRVMLPNGDDAKGAQQAYNAMLAEMDANARMDTMSRLLTAGASVFGFVRYVADLGLQLDVVTPDMITVIPHPEAPTRELAIAYVSKWHQDQPYQHVVWDDKRYFTIGPRGGLNGEIAPHDFGVLPWLAIHQRGRTCHYWQETVGEDLVSQTKQSMFLDCVVVKKIYSQSHIQMTFTGDLDGLIKDQVTDEFSVLVAQGGNSGAFGSIDLQSDPGLILEAKAANEAAVAANYGISRDRLNQKTATAADDVGLHERVAELATVMATAELRLFEIVKRVSREHPRWRGAIPEDATLLVDLGQLFNRVDRKTQLDVRQQERSMGLRSGVDDVLEDNPEFGGDRALAMAYIREKMREESVIVEERRALNAPADASAEEPGQNPAANGAMGPMVRDGVITKDQAASAAKNGNGKSSHSDLTAIAMRVLSDSA